ncbi:MAG: 2-phospho-L-lactate transferase, partial [Sporichthya sp.]
SRAALLAARGLAADAPAVAGLYRDFCRRFVLDQADADRADDVRRHGLEPVVVPTLLHRGADPGPLLRALLPG